MGTLIKDEVLLESLKEFVALNPGQRPTIRLYQIWWSRRADTETIIKRFGSWTKALKMVGYEYKPKRRRKR